MVQQCGWMLTPLLLRLALCGASVLLMHARQPAVDADFGDPNKPAAGFGKGSRMDYGPFLTYTISADRNATQSGNYLAVKGIAFQLDGTNAAVCFDTDTLRMAAGWTGGFLDLSGTHLDSYKGSHPAFVAGNIQFQTPNGPGWASPNGSISTMNRGRRYCSVATAFLPVALSESQTIIRDSSSKT